MGSSGSSGSSGRSGDCLVPLALQGLIFEFINTPNYRGNLCPGDVVLGLEEKLPIDLIPLEDAVVVENQGGKILGVRKWRGSWEVRRDPGH